MRAVVQRVSQAKVIIQQQTVGQIDRGLLVLLGIHTSDTSTQVKWLAEKIVGLRIFEDEAGKMNRSLTEVQGGLLVVSQFTLYGDCSQGRRPSFIAAARPERAIPLYEEFLSRCRELCPIVQAGQFGADMQVHLVNDGPVTLIVETPAPAA